MWLAEAFGRRQDPEQGILVSGVLREMSIRQFSTQWCLQCGKDTTHYVMQCRDCGHVNALPSEIRRRSRAKSALRRKVPGLQSPLPVRARNAAEAREIFEIVRIGKAKDMAVTAQRLLSIASVGKKR
jgi:hypothetical protein